jgi:hypothetical protein
MWLRGAPIELIAKTVGMSKSGVLAIWPVAIHDGPSISNSTAAFGQR